MKLLRSAVLFSSLFSLSLMAQRGGGGGHGGGGGGGGFHGGGGGGGGFRGGGSGGGYRGGYGGYRGGNYGGYRGGWGGFYGGYYGYPGFFGWGNGYPYDYGGVYYNPYYYYDGYYGSSPAAPDDPGSAPAAAPGGVNQTETTAPTAVRESYYRQPDFYLIAFSDHNIRAALSFHVIGDQIEWVPKEGGAVQRAPLASVDKRFSEQINRDRRVKFELP